MIPVFFLTLVTTFCLPFICIQTSQIQATQLTPSGKIDSPSKKLTALCDRYFLEMLQMYPEFATFTGNKNYNDRWTDESEEAHLNRLILIKDLQIELSTIDKMALSHEEKINYFLLSRIFNETLQEAAFNSRYLPLSHISGLPQDVGSTLAMMPKENLHDYQNIVARLTTLPTLVDQTIALLSTGIQEGYTIPKIALRSLPETIQNCTPDDIEASPFFQPFIQFPAAINNQDRIAIVAEATQAIKNNVYPAFDKLHSFLVTAYIPKCRLTIALSDLPRGREWYEFLIAKQTNTFLSPEDIHTIGLTEVERIQEEMDSIIDQCGFNGLHKDFEAYLHTNPDFFYKDAESLLAGYRDLISFINGKLPNFFNKMPKLPCEVVEMPTFSSQHQSSAYYMPGSLTNGRPGRFYVNTFDLPTRPKWQMESLALHEAIPGHHFQISIAQEIKDIPQFRKYTGYNAYMEGWALYTEGLGMELGVYQSPYSKYGRLIEEMWRAVRLVVDTGMHALGWTRQEAIDYFKENTGMGDRDAEVEIDRYIVWPAQALSYKIGELSIRSWRNTAETVLGNQFDIKAFHDVILEQGALPLDLCEYQVIKWLREQSQPQ